MSTYFLFLPLVALVPLVIFLRLFHAPTQLRCKLLEKDDLVYRKVVRAGVASPFRRVYRNIPSDPRCRFCLVPFGGVGAVLGFTPSRKNANFCPG